MQTRVLGRSDLAIPPLMFGGNVFGWTADKAQSFRILDAVLDAGLNAIDTADVYSFWVPGNVGGESETIIGEWLAARGNRDKVVIATKLGLAMGTQGKGLSKAWIETEVEASLRRLQTDYIDLYQAHLDDPETPLEETMQAFASLIKAGKVRVLGASNYAPARLKQALDVSAALGLPRFESLQPLYSLMERTAFEGEVSELVEAEGLGVISYWSLAQGFLSGKYRSKADLSVSLRGTRIESYVSERGAKVLSALDQVAARHEGSPTQVALAWLMARKGVTAPIVSVSKLEQLPDLLKSVTLSLDTDDMALLDSASTPEG